MDAIAVFFRSRGMFAVMTWILEKKDPMFYQQECQQGSGVGSGTKRHLLLLEQAGMIRQWPREEGLRRQYWERTDSPYWGVLQTFLETMQDIELGLPA